MTVQLTITYLTMDETRIGRQATFEEIEAASNKLLGRTAEEVALRELQHGDPTQLKGQFGLLVERYYGISDNSDPHPDFLREGLELKVKPLKFSWGDLLYPKEPLSVGMIDYGEVAGTEYWKDIEKLRRKFLNLFIVWFLHDGESRADYPFIWWQRWSPDDSFDEQIQEEYEEIRRQILEAEHLSETQANNDILQTCPKHNSDFSIREPGSYVTNSGHPHLEKPERRSWRIPSRFLVQMLAEDTGLELISKGGSEYIDSAELFRLTAERAPYGHDIIGFSN